VFLCLLQKLLIDNIVKKKLILKIFMIEDYIRYDQLIDNAMREVVKKALYKAYNNGLGGDHHFLVSFFTHHEGVEISAQLKEQYPEEMTIIIQHQYEDLEVTEKKFKIVLSFDGIKERISVPYTALSSFADPGVKFGLKFNILNQDSQEIADLEQKHSLDIKNKDQKPQKPSESQKTAKKETKLSTQKNVIELASFRKKDK
jgi:hypothetical protein